MSHKKIIFVLIIATLFAAAVFCPAVSASSTVDGQENRIVNIGDTVFQGDQNLNFKNLIQNRYSSDSLRHEEGGAIILLTNGIADIPSNQKTGLYYGFNNTYNGELKGAFFYIAAPASYEFILMLSSPSVKTGDTVKVRVTGEPNKQYTVSVTQGGPEFSTGDKYKQTFTMDTIGEKTLILNVPDTAQQGTYTVSARDEDGEEKTVQFSVSIKKTTFTLTFDFVSDEVRNGMFAVGDVMYLTGNLNPRPEKGETVQPFYLFITGRGLPANGENLKGVPVVDGDTSTFTIVTYDTEKGCWEYYWDTSGFEPGMYTLHIAFEPIGFSKGTSVGGVGSASQEISLSDKSIHVKFAEENGGLFTKGDVMYSYWSARGSPSAVRWYIIGPNFMETGLSEGFPLYTKDQELGKDAPQGLYGFAYPRTFSNSMAAGNYYLLYQHPGFNGEFDVNPNNENGYFTSLTTNFGESASLEERPSYNCAETLQQLITSVRSDDLCVITEITIEEPEITIDQVDNLAIGDSLKIKGTTNYAGKGVTADGTEVQNTFSLTVNRLDFDLAEENAAMKLQIVSRVNPQNVIPYYGERTYEFDAIDTSTWFEGTYEATVTNIDTGFSESIMFTVGGEGVEADSSTLQIPADPLAELDTELEPLPPIIEYPEPVEPVALESPGFLLAPFALGAAIALRRK